MLKPYAFDSFGAAATNPRTASVRRRNFLIWTTFFAFLDERITVRIRKGANAGIAQKSRRRSDSGLGLDRESQRRDHDLLETVAGESRKVSPGYSIELRQN